MASTDARPVPHKNTAYRVYFPILDADGDTVTGAASLDSEVSLDGAAFSDCTNEATEIGTSGIYYLDLTSGEMNADAVVVRVQTATSGAKVTPIIMYPEESGDIRVNTTHWGGTAVASANVLIDGAITAAKIASDAITAAKIQDAALTAAKFASGAFDAVWSVTARLLTAGTNIVLAKGTGVTGFNDLSAAQVNAEVDTAISDAALATAANLATVDTVVDGIKAVTDALPDAGALTSIATASALTTVDTVVDAIKVETDKLADTLEDDAGTYRFTANALEQAPTGGSAPTASEIADAVWEEAIADHSGTSGSTAEQLAAAGSAGDPWATALPGSYTSGQAGKIVGDNLNAPVGTVDTVVDAIKAVTDNLPDSGALTSLATAAALATVDGNVDAILDDTGTSGVVVAAGSKTGYTISGTLTTLDALDTAQDAQHATTQAAISTVDGVVDAILVDTAEIGAAGAGLTAVASAANLATVDTVVDAIKAKTDNLPASPAATSDIPSAASVASAVASAASSDPLSVNIKEINDTALTGDGSSTPWGPA